MMYRVHNRSDTVQAYSSTYHEWVDVVDEPLEYNAAYCCMNNLARAVSRFTSQPAVAIANVDEREVETT